MPSTRSMTKPINVIRQHDALNLVIPTGMRPGKRWFPHRYEPSIVLTRVVPVEYNRLPEPAPVLDQGRAVDAPTIVLGKRIGFDAPYDIYHASYEGAGDAKDNQPGLVARLVDLSHYPKGNAEKVSSIIVREFRYWEQLKELQERVIPRFAGVFEHGTLYCQVFEDAGRAITFEEKVEPSVQAEVKAAFEEIFRAGVLAHTGYWQHIRRGSDGRIKIASISGQSLAELQANPDPEWEVSPEEKYAEWSVEQLNELRLLFSRYKKSLYGLK